MEKRIVDKLLAFGFSDKQIAVYLSILELGTSSVAEIAKKSDINRSTTYVLLEELAHMGLVALSDKHSKWQYVALPPERLIQTLEQRSRKIAGQLAEAHQLIPELKALFSGVGPKPKVRFFEGAEGVISVYEDTLTSTETIRAYASIENMHAALGDYFPSYYQRRAGSGIAIRSVHPDTLEARERVTHDKEEARDSALVPHDEYDFSPEINIYDNKIVFMSLREKFGLIIESEELATAMKKVFELSWKEAKRLNAQIRTNR